MRRRPLGLRPGPTLVRPVIGSIGLGAYLVFVANETLRPEGPVRAAPRAVQSAIRSAKRHGVPWHQQELLLNVALFVPVGVLGYVLCQRALVTVVCAAALSGAIEISQYLWLPSREAQFSDLCTNTLGALIGSVLALGVRQIALALIARRDPVPSSRA